MTLYKLFIISFSRSHFLVTCYCLWYCSVFLSPSVCVSRCVVVTCFYILHYNCRWHLFLYSVCCLFYPVWNFLLHNNNVSAHISTERKIHIHIACETIRILQLNHKMKNSFAFSLTFSFFLSLYVSLFYDRFVYIPIFEWKIYKTL